MDTKDLTPREILMKKDEVTLVDEDGKLLGREEKYLAHKHPAKLHLASSVWLFNSKKQILLQKRSKSKIVGANWWANTVCGNVLPVETYFDCAHRRLKHELNISNVKVLPVYKFTYRAYCNEIYGENEIDQVYIGKFEGQVTPNAEEVSEIVWTDFDALVGQVRLKNYISPEQSLLQETQQLQEHTQPLEVSITDSSGTKNILLSPWSVMMLKDSHLEEAVTKLFSGTEI
jgi:isopentenyl-diphosphate delta-isomerase